MLRSVALVLGLAVFLAGCDLFNGDPEVVTLTGTWEGQTERGEIDVVVELSLEQPTETEVFGSGLLTENEDGASFSVTSGSYIHPTISMQWGFDDRPPLSFGGSVTDDLERIEGALSGAGFGGDELILERR